MSETLEEQIRRLTEERDEARAVARQLAHLLRDMNFLVRQQQQIKDQARVLWSHPDGTAPRFPWLEDEEMGG